MLPLHAGATGRAILGRIGIDALGPESLEVRTPETATDLAELAGLLQQDRRAGYIISVGRQFPLAGGAAAAFSCPGLTGSVSITRPRYLTDDEDLARFGPLARTAAHVIEDQGPTPPVPATPSEITHPAGGTALERMTRLLAVLVAEPAGLHPGRSLARAIGANIATTHRLVATATNTGLALTDGPILHPGPRLLHWAARPGSTRDIGAPNFIDGTVAGSITATVARFRTAHLDLDALARAVQGAAHHITRLLSLTSAPWLPPHCPPRS